MEIDIWSFVGGLVSGGVVSSLITFNLTKTIKVEDGGYVVDQSGARSNGDIVGRDKKS